MRLVKTSYQLGSKRENVLFLVIGKKYVLRIGVKHLFRFLKGLVA